MRGWTPRAARLLLPLLAMCRLAIVPPYIARKMSNRLVELLDLLERVNGGHGNGIGAWLLNGGLLLRKGVRVRNDELVELMSRRAGDVRSVFLWHSRLASAGEVNDENCHPFAAPENSPFLILAHNGHWTHAHRAASELDIPVTRDRRCVGKHCYEVTGFDGKPDSWVMAQWLARKVREEGSRVAALKALYDTLRYDAVIVQFDDGDTYLVATKKVEAAKIGDWWLIASSNIEDVFNDATVYAVSGIWRIANRGADIIPIHDTEMTKGSAEGVVCGIGSRYYLDIDDVTRVSVKSGRKNGKKKRK